MEAIFNMIKNVLVIFAVNVMSVATVGVILGDSGIGSSTFFQLGSQGLAYSTLLQQFLASFAITTVSFLLGNDHLIKRWSVKTRLILIVMSNFIIISGFILVFDWIENAIILGWLCYLISFIITTSCSVYFILEKNKREIIEYNKCLNDFKIRNKGGN